MKHYTDDDFEVLGSSYVTRSRLIKILLICLAGIALSLAMVFALIYFTANRDDKVPEPETIHESSMSDDIEVGDASENPEGIGTLTAGLHKAVRVDNPTELTDSVNDVAFTLVDIHDCYADVTFQQPDSTATEVVLATCAADIRGDNGEIVCEFYQDGKKYTSGIRKKGFCYVSPDGKVTIGKGIAEDLRDAAMTEGGTFFRQYPLVIEGEIQEITLKGKAKRRAIGFKDNRLYFVMSHEREPLHAFAQALADYGFSFALYLPGGEGYLRMKTDRSDYTIPFDYGDLKYVNYIVFKK